MKRIVERLNLTVNRVILRICASWMLVYLIMLNTLSGNFLDLKYTNNVNTVHFAVTVFAAFILLTVFDYRFNSIDSWVLLLSLVLVAFKTVDVYANWYYALFVLIPIAAVLAWMISKDKLSMPKCFSRLGSDIDKLFQSEKGKTAFYKYSSALCLSLIFLLFVITVGTIGVLRYRTYSSPNFDFGIFVNMFHNMKTTFLQTVSCERDAIMSHFEVHISPIWYLLLPFYALFPTPETLQIGQAVILASGVFPLYLLCRKYELSRPLSILSGIVYVCLPALSSGTFYDIHENCFLAPLLLWLFYFFEKDKPIPMYVFAVLTLAVKEDAAIYVALFALYAFFGRKKRLHGTILFVMSAAYMFTVISILEKFGQGAMTGRYSNYIDGDKGLIAMILNCIKNPAYVFSQLAIEGTDGKTIASKLLYIFQMLAPLGFLPVMTKKLSRFILLMPMIVVNLMTLYPYQYQIGFQYGFGSTAFLVYLFLLNASDLKDNGKKYAISFCAIASAVLFTVSCVPNYKLYTQAWQNNREEYETLDSILESVDPDASLTVSTLLLPHVAERSEIYEVHYHSIGKPDSVYTDFVIIDMRLSSGADFSKKYLELDVYEIYQDYPGYIRILIRKDLVPPNL